MDHQEASIDSSDDIITPGQTATIAQPATSTAKNIGVLAWAIFVTGVLYYCFAYLLRVYPSVMEDQLRGYFHITAGGFGLLTSFYYFALFFKGYLFSFVLPLHFLFVYTHFYLFVST